MAERIAYRILGGIVQRDKTRDLAIRNIGILELHFSVPAIQPMGRFHLPSLQKLIHFPRHFFIADVQATQEVRDVSSHFAARSEIRIRGLIANGTL
jgi:hypothetical protein